MLAVDCVLIKLGCLMYLSHCSLAGLVSINLAVHIKSQLGMIMKQ